MGPALMDRWFYVLHRQPQGPLQWTEIRDLARTGVLSPTTLVWGEGMDEWKPATDIPRLFAPKTGVHSIQPEQPTREAPAPPVDPVPWFQTVGAGAGAADSLWSRYHDYHRVPRFRRHEVNSLLCWLSIPFWPLCLWVCVVQATGPIYYPTRDSLGQLQVWSAANKIAAVALPLVMVLNVMLAISLKSRVPELVQALNDWL